ncbi:MAG: hypothetical protein PSX80_17450 [bacterium]|nr:hypothetical protein [bacterium]
MRIKILLLLTAVLFTGVLVSRFTTPSEAQQLRNSSIRSTSVTGLPMADLGWEAIVNNGQMMPNATVNFSSYGQPSVNENGTVVFRARSTGREGSGGNRQTGVYLRKGTRGAIRPVADLDALVPHPNNLGTLFREFPAIPRIAMKEDFPATRGIHKPVCEFSLGGDETTRVGTTGLYMELGSHAAVTAMSKLGGEAGFAPGFEYFEVPGFTELPFDVFPGAPTIADDGTIAFKGNFTVNGVGKTGIFFRRVLDTPGGGTAPVEMIASSDTQIPNLPAGMNLNFGSTAPPTIAGDQIAFLGLDNEDNPSYGGIYVAPIEAAATLTPIAEIGAVLAGTERQLSRIGEALSFDGRYISFWAAWGTEMKTLRLYCPEDGNKDLLEFCNSEEGGSIFDPTANRWYQMREVPVNQGIFVYDLREGTADQVATSEDFDDFVFWGYSGKAPGTGSSEEDAEEPRWRAASFVAASDGRVAFKARTGAIDSNNMYVDPVDGIYIGYPGKMKGLLTVIETGNDGASMDPMIPVGLLPITGVGIERDGFRGKYLAISVAMGIETEDETEELTDWAGIYRTMINGKPKAIKIKNK